MFLIRLEMRKWTKNRIEEILVSNSSLVSGLSEVSGVKFTWSQGFPESPKIKTKLKKNDVPVFLVAFERAIQTGSKA